MTFPVFYSISLYFRRGCGGETRTLRSSKLPVDEHTRGKSDNELFFLSDDQRAEDFPSGFQVSQIA